MTRVGLVGFGGAGAGFHAPLLQAAGLTVTSVVTRNPERIERAARDVPNAHVLQDVDALLRRAEAEALDLIVLASPSGLHVEQARQVVEAGIACVVDKPLACDAHSAVELVDFAAAEGIPLTVFQNRRYDPQFRTLERVLRSGALGELHETELRWERWRPVRNDRWREQLPPEQGGGLLLDLHTHLIDQLVLLHGPVETVYAELAAWTSAGEDDTFLAMRHTGGYRSHVRASSVAGAPGPRVRVQGSAGAYILGSAQGEQTAFPDADAPDGHLGWIVQGPQRQPVPVVDSDPADFYRAVAAALASEDPQSGMPVDPRDAVHVLAVIDAARASNRGRRVMDVLTPGQVPD